MPNIKHNKNEDALYTWLVLLLSLLGLFWSTALAVNSSFFAGEKQLFSWLYNVSASIVGPMLFVTNAGTILLLFGTAIWLEKTRRYILLVRILIGVVLASGLVLILKNIVDRARPDILINITQRELFIIGGQGFPSGHVAIATVIVATLFMFIPKKLRMLAILLPILVGFTRINLGVHLPLDVVGGLSIGLLVATMVRLSTTSEYFIRSHNRIASRIKKA